MWENIITKMSKTFLNDIPHNTMTIFRITSRLQLTIQCGRQILFNNILSLLEVF